jgi:hypothetical protein
MSWAFITEFGVPEGKRGVWFRTFMIEFEALLCLYSTLGVLREV